MTECVSQNCRSVFLRGIRTNGMDLGQRGEYRYSFLGDTHKRIRLGVENSTLNWIRHLVAIYSNKSSHMTSWFCLYFSTVIRTNNVFSWMLFTMLVFETTHVPYSEHDISHPSAIRSHVSPWDCTVTRCCPMMLEIQFIFEVHHPKC